MECDICGGSNTPRNPYWRDNLTKTCDPCEAKIEAKLGAARPTPVEPEARPDPDWEAIDAELAEHEGDFDSEPFSRRLAVEPDGLPLDVREMLTKALGELWVLDSAVGMIHRWHDDPNLDCKAEAQKALDQRAKVHDLIVSASRRLASTPSEAKP